MGSAEYPVRSIIIPALILLSTHIVPGTCSDRERSGRGPIAVEISRRSRPQASPAAIAVDQRRLSSAGARTGMLDVQDCENAEYSGWIGLGTPMQEFEVVLDTGSYTLWVTSSSCNEGCDSGNKYDSSASTTYEPDGTSFTQSYEDGSEARGILSVDVLSVGGLTTEATFGEMTTRSLDGCKTVDGVMGMGLSSSGDGKNVFETLVDAGVVDVPIFAFFIGDVDTDMSTGVLTLGGVNQTHYEECLRWVSISQFRVDGYWSVDLMNLELGGTSILETKATAILDTGTSMIVGPYDDVGYLADKIGAWCVALVGADSSSVIEVDCLLNPAGVQLILMPCDSEFEDLTFQLGWQQFTLTANELLLPLTDFGPANPSTMTEPWCVFGMMGHDSSFWILGDTFLRTFYTAYDVKNKKVGLAKATVNRAGEVCSDDVTISADVVEPAPTSLSSSVDDSSVSGGTSAALQTLPTTSEADPTSTMPGDSTSSSRLDDSEGGSAVTNDTKSSEEGKDESRGTVMVAAISSILTMIALIACCGIGVLVHRRIRKGTTHRHTQLGVSGKAEGGVEMASNGVEVIGAGDADDFLQAQPVSYRSSGSGSHRYRVAAEAVAVAANNGRGASGVTVLGNHGGMIVVDDEEEEDDDEVVEVDFGVSNETTAVTPMARLGRMFGRGGRAAVGFTAFRDGEESSDRQQSHLV